MWCRLFLCIFPLTFAQGQNRADENDFRKASALFQNGQYADALYYLNRISAGYPGLQEVAVLSSESYRLTGDYANALRKTQYALRPHSSLELKRSHFNNLLACGALEEARLFINSDSLLKQQIPLKARMDSLEVWSRHTGVILENLVCNSHDADISAVEYKGQLLFSSNREGFFIRRKNSTDATPYFNFLVSNGNRVTLFSDRINTREHDFSPSLSMQEDTLYFTRRVKAMVKGQSFFYFKLYSCELVGNKWTPAHEFILNDSASSYAYPFLDEKSGIFYFASDRDGGYGGWDIYICIREDSLWSDPINLGPIINTEQDEIYPIIQNNVLYYSSNGHSGLGGYDIFCSKFKRGKWSNPRNLQCPVNSGADDMALSFSKSGVKAWFTSNRPGGKGKEDIYEIKDVSGLVRPE